MSTSNPAAGAAAAVAAPQSGSAIELLLPAESDPEFQTLQRVGPFRLARVCGKFGLSFDLISSCAFSSDSGSLAIAARNQVVVLSTETWGIIGRAALPTGRNAAAIGYLADDTVLVVDDESGLYRLHPGRTELDLIPVSRKPEAGYDILYGFDPELGRLTSVSENRGTSVVIDIDSGTAVAEHKLTTGLGVPRRIEQAAAAKAAKKVKKAAKKKTTAKKATAKPRRISIDIEQLAVDLTGRYAAFGTSVDYVSIVELATGTEIATLLLPPRKRPDSIAVALGASLVAIEFGATIEVWDLRIGLRVCEVPFKRSTYVNSMCFGPSGRSLLVAFDGCVLLIDLVDGDNGHALRAELSIVLGDGSTALATTTKATRAPAKKKAVARKVADDFDDDDDDFDDDDDDEDDDDYDDDDDTFTPAYGDALISADGRYVVATEEGLIHIVDRQSGIVRHSPPIFEPYNFRLNADGRYFNALEQGAGGESHYTVWNADTGQCVARLPNRDVDECVVSEDGSTLALFREDGGFEVYALEPAGPKLRMRNDLDSDYPTLIALSRDGARVACTSSDELLHVFDVATGKELVKVKAPSAMSMSLTLDGCKVAIAQSLKKETICIYEVATAKLEWKQTVDDDFEDIAFTDDGNSIWCVSEQYIDFDDDEDNDDDDDDDDDDKPIRLDLLTHKVVKNPGHPPPNLRKPARDVLRALHGKIDVDAIGQSRDGRRLVGIHARGVACVFDRDDVQATPTDSLERATAATAPAAAASSPPPSVSPAPTLASPSRSVEPRGDDAAGGDGTNSLLEALLGKSAVSTTAETVDMAVPTASVTQPAAPEMDDARRAALQAGVRSDMAAARKHLDLTWLTSLDTAASEVIATWAAGATDAREITLAGLAMIDADSARALSIWAAGNTGFSVLTLDGLRSLDAPTARALAAWGLGNLGPCRLSLDGLRTLEADAADALADWAHGNGGTCTLSLNGLTAIDVEVARALARWAGGNRGGCTLSLSGLKSLDALAAWTLADWARGDGAPRELVLGGLTAIDAGIAHALAAWARGNTGTCKLDLAGVSRIDSGTAAGLAGWTGGNVGECILSLDGLRTLDGPTAEALAAWSGDNAAARVLSLNGLAGMEAAAGAFLREWAARPNRTLQCWANV